MHGVELLLTLYGHARISDLDVIGKATVSCCLGESNPCLASSRLKPVGVSGGVQSTRALCLDSS